MSADPLALMQQMDSLINDDAPWVINDQTYDYRVVVPAAWSLANGQPPVRGTIVFVGCEFKEGVEVEPGAHVYFRRCTIRGVPTP